MLDSWDDCPITQTLNEAQLQFIGENGGDNAGYSVSSAGDVDGDGLDDILVGADLNDFGGGDAGKIYLILGSSLGVSSIIDLSLADYSFIGEGSYNFAGSSVSSAGDVDGDGLDDILIGAWGNGNGGVDAGKVYLILGSSLGVSSIIDLSLADYSFIGENSYNFAGSSVSSAGDVDGDGLDDILIGASGNDEAGPYAGKIYLILGSSLGVSSIIDLSVSDYSFIGESNYDYAGNSVSSAGDVNGDGLDDILIGAHNNNDGGWSAGKTYLILGSSLGVSSIIDLSLADYSFIGENADDLAGSSVSSAGDVNGDGFDDILIGAYLNDQGKTDAGKIYLILGSSLGVSSIIDLSVSDYSFIGETAGDNAGNSVSSVGDVDGDGLDDILIGAWGNGNNGVYAGKTYLIFGSSLAVSSIIDLSVSDYFFIGENANDFAGYSVSSAGDVDGDGLDDILMGAYGSVAGKAALFKACPAP
jgi:hypothetical protein